MGWVFGGELVECGAAEGERVDAWDFFWLE